MRRLTRGHVNESWLVAQDGRRYVLQRINRIVFKDPRIVARNLVGVSGLLRSRDVRTVRVRATRQGEPWFLDGGGDLWRAYEFVDGRVAQPRSMLARHDVAFAFGAFARALGDLDEKEFESPIPRFHDFDHRARRFERAVIDDRAGRARSSADDIARVRELIERVRALDEFAKWKRQPVRLVHNDAKPANLVRHAHERPCVIDLDTIGPGRLGYDLGELVRSIIPENGNAPLDLLAIENVWAGFVDGWRHPLDRAERSAVPIAGVVLSTELAGRFVTDHLEGDRYFAIGRGATNQMRARVQMRRAALQLDALDHLRERAENLLSTRP
jgi:N-acetylhexosamine 1-kinase